MLNSNLRTCFIWQTPAKVRYQNKGNCYFVDSARAGSEYKITKQAKNKIEYYIASRCRKIE